MFGLFFELQPELEQLGPDDRAAVRRVRVQVEVILVVLLRLVKRRRLGDLRHDRSAKFTGSVGRLFGFYRHGLVCLAVEKNRRAILGADIGALPVERGRVVRLPENSDYFFQ